MSEQQHELQEGDTVQIATAESYYNGMRGIIKWIMLPPPWIPEDQWGYEFFVDIGTAFQMIVPFYKHEVRRVEAKEEL